MSGSIPAPRLHVLRGSHGPTGLPGRPVSGRLRPASRLVPVQLLTGCAIDGRAPYKALLTHGFVVDGKGKKMSKSTGNVIAPQKVMDTYGADILRLWVASTDYSGELTISDEILKRASMATAASATRCASCSPIADFDIDKHAVSAEASLEIDRYALALTREMQTTVLADYAVYNYHAAMQRLQIFCSEDLGAFYLDVLKDRLYTSGANSTARRAAQTTLWHILQTLTKLLAPVLSFTAEEIWQLAGHSGERGESVFLESWHELPVQGNEVALLARWGRLRELRALTTKRIEELRVAGSVGSSLQAEVTLLAAGDDYDLLTSLGEDLKFVLITSAARVEKSEGESGEPTRVEASASSHQKCERCWHYRDDVGDADAAHPGLCGRCVSNLHGSGESRVCA
jgi:isoleucyl-tRNA synthetase